MGMATVGNMMSQVMKSKAKVTDPVSTVVYKQFKQAGLLLSFFLKCSVLQQVISALREFHNFTPQCLTHIFFFFTLLCGVDV